MDPAATLRVPVCSDPKWLRSAVLGMTAGVSGLFIALFARTNVSAALGVLPGMTVGVCGVLARGVVRGGRRTRGAAGGTTGSTTGAGSTGATGIGGTSVTRGRKRATCVSCAPDRVTWWSS